MNFDARLAKPSGGFGQPPVRARIDADHLLSAGAQRERGRRSRSSEAEDQVRATGERRPRLHARMLSWYTVKPIAPHAAATNQKRRMNFVSDHAWSSKWWWIGAIRTSRLRIV